MRALIRAAPAHRDAAPAAAFPSFIICGIEHSGTTLLSDLFRQVPGLGSGFEVGALLADRPSAFPTVEHFGDFAGNWGLGPHDVDFICAAPDFPTFYRRLMERAGVLPPGTAAVFDKTPRYLVALSDCLRRVPAPFVVTTKDPRAILHSGWVRDGRPPLMPWLDDVQPERLAYLLRLYAQYRRHRTDARVLFMPLERLCLAAGESCERIFAHVGQSFDPRFFVLRGIDNRATHGSSIQVGLPFAYRHDWPQAAIRTVETRFAALQDWFHA